MIKEPEEYGGDISDETMEEILAERRKQEFLESQAPGEHEFSEDGFGEDEGYSAAIFENIQEVSERTLEVMEGMRRISNFIADIDSKIHGIHQIVVGDGESSFNKAKLPGVKKPFGKSANEQSENAGETGEKSVEEMIIDISNNLQYLTDEGFTANLNDRFEYLEPASMKKLFDNVDKKIIALLNTGKSYEKSLSSALVKASIAGALSGAFVSGILIAGGYFLLKYMNMV